MISLYENDANNENQIQKDNKFNFNAYLTDNEEFNFFNESNKLIWSINNTETVPHGDLRINRYKWGFKCKFTEDSNLKCLHRPYKFGYHLLNWSVPMVSYLSLKKN